MLAYLDTVIGFAVVMLGVSLVITILTQVVSAALNHRGANLKWGLQTLFENVDPNLGTLKKQAGSIADQVLTHCLISDSWFNKWFPWLRRATAIRPAELAAILQHIANAEAPGSSLASDINKLLTAANPEAARQVTLVTGAIGEIKGPLKTAIDAAGSAAQPFVKDAVESIQKTAGNLEAWFNSMMDRVSQRFAMTMRIWTVIFAALFAAITGLNSIDLVKELYANGDFRTQLANGAKPISEAAEQILAGAQTPDEAVRKGLETTYTGALQAALTKAGSTVTPPTSGIVTVAAARDWVNRNVTENRQAVLDALETTSEEATRALIQKDSEAAAKVRNVLTKSGFEMIAFHYPDGFFQRPFFRQQLPYYFGVLVTIMFLSLGAPFWFNGLKTLTNLRPIVATKAQAEKKEAAAA